MWSLIMGCMSVIFCTVRISNAAPPNRNKVFLLVLDGFVHDFENLTHNTSNLMKLAAKGVKAERFIPSFPSDTWPSMTTLNTGLYTESHGIVRNRMYNAKLNKTFDNNTPNFTDIYQPFFTQEPFWLTNQKQGGIYLCHKYSILPVIAFCLYELDGIIIIIGNFQPLVPSK